LLFHYTRTHTNVQKPGTYSQNKLSSPPAFWSSRGFLVISWITGAAEQGFRFDVLMRGVLLLFCFCPRARRNHARDPKKMPLFIGGMCDRVEHWSFFLACFLLSLQTLATGWLYVVVAVSCDWLGYALGVFARADEDITYLLTMCTGGLGSGIPPVFLVREKQNK
jgi:hypothetical protein